MDSLKLRKALIHSIDDFKQRHIFDGNLLYAPMRLPDGQVNTPIVSFYYLATCSLFVWWLPTRDVVGLLLLLIDFLFRRTQ